MLNLPRPDLSAKSFLIIEDYEGMRGILRDLLGRAGATRISFAANAQTAIPLLERHRFDAVLCDLHLGHGFNGQQILEEARHRQLLAPQCVWLMISAEKTAEMVTGTMESRPDDYLLKPITETLLFTRLSRQIARRQTLAPIEQAMRDREYLKAIQLTDSQLNKATPHLWDLKRLKAELALQVGDHAQARAIYAEALAQRDLPWAHLGLAKIHFHEGRLAEAREELERVTADHHAYLEAHDWLAHTLAQLGELDAAQAVLRTALATSPHAPQRQGQLGEIAYRRGDLDTAAEAFRRQIELARQTPLKAAEPYLRLSRVQVARGQGEEALRTLAELSVDLHEDDTARLLARALEIPAHVQAGSSERARALAAELAGQLAERAHALPAEAILDLAKPLIELGVKDTAASLLTSLVGNNHEHPEILERARAVFAETGHAEEGDALVERAARAATECMNQGVKLAHAGKLDEAIAFTREARERMPSNPRLLLNHAFLLIAWMEQHGRDPHIAGEARTCIEAARRLKPGEKRAGELLTRLELVGNDFAG